jgi:hypothetical protein
MKASTIILLFSHVLLSVFSQEQDIIFNETNNNDILQSVEVDINGEDPSIFLSEHPLLTSASLGDLSSLLSELQNGLDHNIQNENGWTALMVAVEYEQHEVVKKVIYCSVFCESKYRLIICLILYLSCWRAVRWM